jgi:hypothetical protein
MENKFCHHLALDIKLELTSLMQCKLIALAKPNNQWMTRIKPDEALNNFLKPFNLVCNQARVFYTPPGGTLRVHADCTEKTSQADYVDVENNQYTHTNKINWVFGAKESTMTWWRPNNASGIGEQLVTVVGSPYIPFVEENCTKIWSEHITDPCLVNVGQPHSVENTTTEGRWCMSFAISDIDLTKTLTWEDVTDRLKDYIK